MRKSKKTALLRLTTIATALKSILSVAALVPITAMGLTLDVQNNKAVVDGEGGDALLFPFYTVANDAITSFSITNSSNNQVVVAKIRFREQVHSVDTFGIYVILSPRDRFDFWVADDGPNGRPMVHWDDKSCLVGPLNGSQATEFPQAWQPFVETNYQTIVGHLEVLGVVDLSQTLLGPYAVHVNGVPRNCQVLTRIFSNSIKVSRLNDNLPIVPGGWVNDDELISGGYGPLNSVDNVLMGRYAITFPEQGIEAEGEAIVIQNSNLADPINTENPPRWHIPSQVSGLCSGIVPSNCRTTSFYAWDYGEWAHPHLGEMTNLANLQRLLSAASLAGHWNNNPANAVGTDWVISFPTKYAYMDMDYASYDWHLLPNTKTGFGLAGAWVPSDSTNLSITSVNPRLYGTEEQIATGGGTPEFPFAVNVLTPIIGTEDSVDSLIQTTDLHREVVFSGLNVSRGWADLPLTWRGAGDAVTLDYQVFSD